MLATSLTRNDLVRYVSKQVEVNFPDGGHAVFKSCTEMAISLVLQRIEKCFTKVKSRYYRDIEGRVFFNHLNGDHYCAFLYLLSNELYKAGNETEATKAFLLNKMMFGIDVFYSVELPEVFLFIHPLGTIVGNADYSDYLVIYQGVTIGSLIEGKYPQFSEKTIIYSNSSVIGNCSFGQNCIVGARSYVIDTQLEDNQIVLGGFPDNRIIENKKPTIDYYFHLD